MTSELLQDLEKQLTPIPEDSLETFFPAVFFLEERREYFFELPGITQLMINNNCIDSKLPGRGIFQLSIADRLGLTCIQPVKDGQVVGSPFWVEVYSTKFPAPNEHSNFFQALVDDLYRKSANLPFTFENQTQRGVSELPRMPTLLFLYHFLRCAVESFEQAINTIVAEPHRVLADNPEQVMLYKASEVDSDVILSILQTPESWVETNEFHLSRLLQAEGRYYAPEHVWQRQPEETYDTPENRFVLHFLRQILTAVDKLPSLGWWKKLSSVGTNKIRELASILREAVAHPMFAEVGDLYHLPANSQVLMRREGYRELYKLWQQFNSSRHPLFDHWQQAIDMREIYYLYELWVFFKLINMVGWNNPCQKLAITISDELGVEYKSRAVFRNNEELIYNQTFHPNWNENKSYSLVMRPDYLWRSVNPKRQVILDAKFSMSITEKELEDENKIEDDPSSTIREGYPIRDNLYRMHTYRDALHGTQAAVILYPGTQSIFMSVKNHKLMDVTLEEVLHGTCERQSTQYEIESYLLDGIGAIPLRPYN